MDLVTKIKQFFGIYTLTAFEEDLIEAVEQNLSAEQRKVFRDQRSRLNRVGRHLKPDRDNPSSYGYTEFYWKRFGKSILEFPMVFSTSEKNTDWAIVKVKCGTNEIIATFTMVKGAFFSIQFRSPMQAFYPDGPYQVTSVEILL